MVQAQMIKVGYDDNQKFLMSSKFKKVGNFMKNFDMFSATQFLRYKGDPDYTTATGGITSLIILAVFIILFSNMGLQTAKKQIIFATSSTSYENNPSPATITTSPDGMFMFAVYMEGLNLNDPSVRYFDISLKQRHYTSGFTLVNWTNIPLQPCTEEHFGFSEESRNAFMNFNGMHWLCPPIGQEFSIKGRYTSDAYHNFAIQVHKCDATAHANCINDTALAAVEASLGQFMIKFPVVNTVINADKEEYNITILQDRNMFTFAMDRAISVNAYIEQNKVVTDESLLPFTYLKQETFLSIPEYFIANIMSVVNDRYVEAVFIKSPQYTTFTRSFNKVDNYFSYVGGLIGTILGFMVVLSAYSEKAYSISIGSKLFSNNDGGKISSQGFHIGYLFSLFIKGILDKFGCCADRWKKTSYYEKCLQEVDHQLDISIILKRLLLIQRAMSALLSNQQLEVLNLQDNEQLDEAQQKRNKFDLPQKVKGNIEEQEQVADESSSQQQDEKSQYGNNAVAPLGPMSPAQIITDQASIELSAVTFSKMSHTSKDIARRSIETIFRQSREGNEVSKRIAAKISPQILIRLGFDGQEDIRETCMTNKKAERFVNISHHHDEQSEKPEVNLKSRVTFVEDIADD